MSAKTFAILTDIHSNFESFEAALSVIEERGNVDQIVLIGDYFSLGPAPVETLDRLLQLEGSIVVRGNHERYIKERLWDQDNPTLEGMDPDDQVTKDIVANEKWTADQIGERGLDFISELDVSYREFVGTTLVEFTHAYFERDEEPPTMDEAKEWRQKALIENPDLDRFVFVHGHAHLPREENDGDLTIFCQGATGLPFDKDDRGAVAFLTVNDGVQWDVVRFDYNRDATINLLEERQPPFYANLQNTIRYAEIRNDI
ncbi:MAG: metallophosphoesterase [Candidatus Marinimicrobia bacterium]|jgi:predicted phosphodiesterase|nr:metallophosphoesterase [Candidatus Neomarinimicrobiota bacterium]MDP6789975.1 metallophosphoesterase [Candidatus Neomarinimicrobiota bacterium]MDP7071440.1 metallophosphoesterase [Candidatus Neomarinimicrobiota bacterium]